VDHWYDGQGHWAFQRITGNHGDRRFGNTDGPPCLFDTRPSIWVDESSTQQHFTYVGVDRAIYDAFWDGDSKRWNLQKLTSGGLTDGPAAWSSPSVCNYQPTGIVNTVYIAYRDQVGAIWAVAYANESWFSFEIKDLPFGAPAVSTVDVPRAAGDVIAWVDVSDNQLHFTFRGTDLLGPVVPHVPPVAVEARVARATRRHPTLAPAEAAPDVLARARSVIWDLFYEPAA